MIKVLILHRYFTEAVLDVFNSQEVFLYKLHIEHNQGTGIVHASYRGNTGGVAIGMNAALANFSASPTVEIKSCIFINNSALATANFNTIDQTSFRQVFTGRGGALGVFVNESFYNISVRVSDCEFQHNFARSFGGGIYVLLNGVTAQHKFKFDGTSISSNAAQLHGGGGVQFSFLSNGIRGSPHMANFTDCTFEDNMAEAGGGIYVFTSTRGKDLPIRLYKCIDKPLIFIPTHLLSFCYYSTMYVHLLGLSVLAIYQTLCRLSLHYVDPFKCK